MNRRSFVKNASILPMSASILPLASAKSNEKSPNSKTLAIKKSLKFGMVKIEASVMEKFQLVKDIGFDGIELDSPNDLNPKEILAAQEKTGLLIPGVVNSYHWKYPLSDPDPMVRQKCVDSCKQALRDCKLYGGDTVLIVPGVVNEQTSYEDAWIRSQTEIRKLIPIAEETGVRIAFENVWNNFILSPLEAARYVDDFNHSLVGWYFDIGNIVRYGWPQHWIQTLNRRIMKLDVKEYSRVKQKEEGVWKGFQVELMEGDCQWPQVIQALDKIGYAGWASAEVPGGDEQRLSFIYDRMKQIFDISPK